MTKVFRLISLPLILSLISCNAPKEKIEKAEPIQTEIKITEKPQVTLETIPQSSNAKYIVTAKGLEDITFGMTEEEVKDAFKGVLIKENDAGREDCFYLSPETIGVSFMIYSGKFQRIDVYDTLDVVTEKGAGIGKSIDAIEKLYPNSHRKPNFYSYPIEDIIVQFDENTKIIFEQGANDIVSHFRLGTLPSVEFVEGCL